MIPKPKCYLLSARLRFISRNFSGSTFIKGKSSKPFNNA